MTFIEANKAPEHGGRLQAASRRWGIPLQHWLDLSTGINPRPWPYPGVRPEIPEAAWQRLPEEDDGLEQVVRAALSLPAAAACVPVPGTQAAIQCLPGLRAASVVAVPAPGYAEHAYCWQKAGHRVLPLSPEAISERLDELDVVIWIQPNNPTGRVLPADVLESWHARLAGRGGWLVVDEAFVEPEPRHSLVSALGSPGLVVLRSLGKFYGLAGARGGLMLGPEDLCGELRQALGPWAVAGPTRWLMIKALKDTTWQARTRERLTADSRRLAHLLHQVGLPSAGGTALFRYCPHPAAAELRDALAGSGILVRCFEQPPGLRFGLPGAEEEWQRLEVALNELGLHAAS